MFSYSSWKSSTSCFVVPTTSKFHMDQWGQVLFTDESPFGLHPDSRIVLTWRPPGEYGGCGKTATCCLASSLGHGWSDVQGRCRVATANSSYAKAQDAYDELNCLNGQESLCRGSCLQSRNARLICNNFLSPKNDPDAILNPTVTGGPFFQRLVEQRLKDKIGEEMSKWTASNLNKCGVIAISSKIFELVPRSSKEG
ncbi:hypothetical protein ANN_26515 [Periplaneta americana]|uniref:Uncharacterized protein n=1 Tax=Periplaneta americana TaxID=6978 RepID=A0ABQ8RYA3_PERAM|nr:hypothetical protein ANN_26515 [Periplaneta americana]